MPPPVRQLAAAYAQLLMQHGFGTDCNRPYAYAAFASGVPIHDYVRRMFREWTPQWMGDPFTTYEAFLHQPWQDCSPGQAGLLVTNFMAYLWHAVPGLKGNFDLQQPQDVREFVAWYVLRARTDLGLDDAMVAPVRRHLEAHGISLDSARRPANVVDLPISDNDRLLLEGLRRLRHLLAPAGSWREDALRGLHRMILARIASRSAAKRAAEAARKRSDGDGGPGHAFQDVAQGLAKAPASPR